MSGGNIRGGAGGESAVTMSFAEIGFCSTGASTLGG